MATKPETDFPPSPTNNESEGENDLDCSCFDNLLLEICESAEANNSVADHDSYFDNQLVQICEQIEKTSNVQYDRGLKRPAENSVCGNKKRKRLGEPPTSRNVDGSPQTGEDDGEAHDPVDYPEDGSQPDNQDQDEEEQVDIKPKTNQNVSDLLKRLQSTGALIKKPKQEFKCYTCDEDFPDWEELENHLIKHVSLPSVVLDKLPSEDEDFPPSGDENWSDEDEDTPVPAKTVPAKNVPKTTPQKMDISQILKKTGLTLKKPAETGNKDSSSALNKLSGLGFTIKKNSVQVKKEPESEKSAIGSDDVLKKLGQLGGIKLKLKSDGNKNSFTVVNGLKDFKASDDEDEGSGNEGNKDDQVNDEELEKSGEQDGSGGSADEENHKTPKVEEDSDDSDKSPINKKISAALKNLKAANSTPIKKEGVRVAPNTKSKSPAKDTPQPKPAGRPTVKQTPKRGANLPIASKEIPKEAKEVPNQRKASTTSADQRVSRDSAGSVENVAVKKEIDAGEPQASSVPLFSGQIKSERASPPATDTMSTPIIARVKTEPEGQFSTQINTTNQSATSVPSVTMPLLAVTKQEDSGMTIIEINGDSGDDDDDCCVVSATPAPDIKPVIPKTEPVAPVYPPPAYPTSTPSSVPFNSSSSSILTSRLGHTLSTEKQHSFNWNAPDTKPPIDMLEKSADDIFESLLSSGTKKENLSLSDVSEYISLDTLGPQQTCDVCNTRFTDMSLLEEHRRMTGHSKSLVIPSSSSSMLPYNPASSSLLSSLLPVKQLAEQVGKLSTISSGPGFTHQQNVMINIQAYPGAGGMGPPQSPYGAYPSGQSMHPGYGQPSNTLYGPGQTMPGQYPGQHYMGQQSPAPGYGQYQPPMSKPGYPSPNSFATQSTPYSTASPLQSMQQAYGQSAAGMMNTQTQMGQMGPPGSSPSQYASSSSPGSMKPPTSSGVRIQNVQTFQPGQMAMPGQTVGSGSDMSGQVPGSMGGNQMPSPSQIRMAAGATVTGTRPRMPGAAGMRGARPSIRPGIQVHGQVRGKTPGARMPMKRPAGMMPGGPGQKRRPDMLLPGKHDNEDCQVMAMQKQRDGLPMISSVQGAKDKLNLGSQISITKKTVNKEANAMANVLASRGISVKQKQKSRSPTPERPIPHIPNLPAGMSIKHTSKSSNFSIPEAKVGGGMQACKFCKKMFMNQNSLQVHMSSAHPQSKLPMFKCDECPASYAKSLQLQHHKRVFHNVTGPNRELGLPVVDLSQEDNLKRLSSLGIYSFIPLANREQTNGCFGIPVISVANMQNGITGSLQALGADGLLSLGPLKPLPNT